MVFIPSGIILMRPLYFCNNFISSSILSILSLFLVFPWPLDKGPFFVPSFHYEIAPIETRRPIKVGYHDALRALQSVPLVAVFFVSQHESSRVFVYLFAQEEGVYVRKR